MREIKFRAWDKNNNKFVDDITNVSIVHGMSEDDNYITEQYSGLNDSKRTKEFPGGDEIFEGDIVSINNDSSAPWKVIFSNGSFDIVSGSTQKKLYNNNSIVEKIGNIHQNPKLLKQCRSDVKENQKC